MILRSCELFLTVSFQGIKMIWKNSTMQFQVSSLTFSLAAPVVLLTDFPTNDKRRSNGFKDESDIRLKARVIMKQH